MKLFIATLSAFAIVAATATPSITVAQQSSAQNAGTAHKAGVRQVQSVSTVDPGGVQIVVVTEDGSDLTLQMDDTTARSLAAQIRTLQTLPRGAP